MNNAENKDVKNNAENIAKSIAVNNASRNTTKKMVILAMFSALAYVTMLVGRIHIGFAPFLKYDPKDIFIVLAGFIYGPVSALLVTIVVAFIEMFTVSDTGWIGFFMNVISSAAFACIASLIYKKRRCILNAVLGVVAGTVAMVVLMLIWNYIMTPIYMHVSRDAVVAMLIPVFLPFNLIKGSINAAFTIVFFKPLEIVFKKLGLMSGK